MLDIGGVALNDGSRALWLMLRNDAGWWSAAQLTHYWRPTFSIGEVEAHLQTLHKGRFLERLRINVNTFAYAVTPACLPLPGLQRSNRPLQPPHPPPGAKRCHETSSTDQNPQGPVAEPDRPGHAEAPAGRRAVQ